MYSVDAARQIQRAQSGCSAAHVMVFMKGAPADPKCKFSRRLVRMCLNVLKIVHTGLGVDRFCCSIEALLRAAVTANCCAAWLFANIRPFAVMQSSERTIIHVMIVLRRIFVLLFLAPLGDAAARKGRHVRIIRYSEGRERATSTQDVLGVANIPTSVRIYFNRAHTALLVVGKL